MTTTSLSYYHRGGRCPLLGTTIPEHFADIAERYPDNEAVVSIPQKCRLTYSQLVNKVDALAGGLSGMGFTKGDRIGVWSTNNVEWLLLQLATARIGAILVNINPAYRPKELAYALEKSEVQGLFVIPAFRKSNYVDMLVELIPELKSNQPDRLNSNAFPLLRRIVVYEPTNPDGTQAPYPGFTTWPQVLALGEGHCSMDVYLDIDDPINIQYTSGTTGFPKAVLLTHHNILNNAYFSAKAMCFDSTDRLVAAVPFYHCFGMVLVNLLCLSVGACIVIPSEHFDALEVLQAIANERCTGLHGVPTMFIAELEHPKFHEFDLSSLRTGIMAGAPCPPALMQRVIEDMHCQDILIGYGQTEASPLTHITARDDSVERRINTVGRNLPHQEVKIVDPKNRQAVPLGQPGEICFRGYHIMQGYYGDTEATHKTIDEHGWLYSGDLGVMDADGYVQITGRLKEMIIRGGENIYPREIEDVLFTHPDIAEAAVFGVPDTLYGEEVMAWIQLRDDASITETEIRKFLKDKIAHFKIPKHIWFVTEFPMTVTGKLQKFRMQEIARQKMEKSG
ncbi:MAG: AMP-binding protein [Arenicellales bacterium]|nr:AMP-binding protein [Arenicellales bacterium]